MSRSAPAAILGACIFLILPFAAGAQSALTEQEAHAIGVDAYLYLYPLVTMDVTRKQFTNIGPGKEPGKGPMNTFANVPEYPPANFKGVVRPNFDTLYSIAWLDLTKEPAIVSAPDTNGRYYLLPMLDMWTDVFASPGWRTTGTQAGNFLVASPSWSGAVPNGTTQIMAPTPLRLDHRPNKDRRAGGLRRRSQDTSRLQGHTTFGVGQASKANGSADRLNRRYENATEGPGGYDACGQILCLCGRPSQD
jgi:hypothetical protein